MHHALRTRAAVAVLAAFVLTTAIACSGDDDEPAPSAEVVAADATATAESAHTPASLGDGWVRVEGLRSQRYCEVLLLRIVEGRLMPDVWNTFGLNDCPQPEWDGIDTDTVKTEFGALAALRNGPRYWLMDAIERKAPAERQEAMLGGLRMFLAATVDLGPPPPNLAPFTERVVDRETVFEFAPGSEVYQLTAPDGRVFVMQSYSVQNDATLTEATLPALGPKLTLPEGWAYSSVVLDDALRVETPRKVATVVQDNLNNTYQLIETP